MGDVKLPLAEGQDAGIPSITIMGLGGNTALGRGGGKQLQEMKRGPFYRYFLFVLALHSVNGLPVCDV